MFDIILALIGVILGSWLLVIVYIGASLDTRSNGLFFQKRVGQNGKLFVILKFKTYHPLTNKVSGFGRFLRRSKFDELPQLINVLAGQMSFVGPRPDVPGYYDMLEGEARKILGLRPGITGLASLKYADEEKLLSQKEFPEKYYNEVIFPDKVKLNMDYLDRQSLLLDIQIILKTLKQLL